ncbi:MAG: tetratricopeptide repeat protein [Limisphaerales bacterium]
MPEDTMKEGLNFRFMLAWLLLVGSVLWLGYWGPLEYRAVKGKPEPQYQLGRCYYYGLGVRRDFSQAAHWFALAANQGHAKAETALGVMSLAGTGQPRNYRAALTWFRRAAEQGLPEAQNQLGMLYAQGRAVPQDLKAAELWFSRAANQGCRAAAENLKLLSGTQPTAMASLTLRNGKTYQTVRVQKVEWDALTISFEPRQGGIGVARLEFADLPEALQHKFGYHPSLAHQLADSSELSAIIVQPL